MPGTYSKILLHVVFSTKRRAAMIKPAIQDRLYDYMGGIPAARKERRTRSAVCPITCTSCFSGGPTSRWPR